jgi:hypothetical protein
MVCMIYNTFKNLFKKDNIIIKYLGDLIQFFV